MDLVVQFGLLGGAGGRLPVIGGDGTEEAREAGRLERSSPPGVLLNGHLCRGSFTLRDDEESVAFEHDLLHIRDEMVSKDHELAGVAPDLLILGLRDPYGPVALLQTTLANHDHHRVLRIGLERRFDAFIDHP